MNTETKNSIQTYTAIGMLFSGVSIAWAGFIVSPLGEIHDSVLWIFAQCLIYAGSIFGVATYVNGRFTEITNIIHTKAKEASDERQDK